MNTKHFPAFSLIIFILLSTLVSCSPEDPFTVCKISEYDCDFQQRIPGIITITKGSSRRHYILTEKGMKRAAIKEGEPVAYNPGTGTALVKEVTDSSIDVFTVDTKNGDTLSSVIPLKPNMTGRDGKPFFAVPSLVSGCIQNDGTIVLLVNYEKPLLGNPGAPEESYDFLYVYEKGDAGKLKKYVFPYYEEKDDETEAKRDEYFWDEPKNIQCTGENIYIFSERNYDGGEFFHYHTQPNWVMERIETAQQEKPAITPVAVIAYDNIAFNLYSEQENAVYSLIHSEKEKELLGKLVLAEGYELPEEPVEKENGNFLLSVTPDGRTLVFFIQTRESIEVEQKIELLPL